MPRLFNQRCIVGCAVASIGLACSAAARAAWPCSIDHAYPEVSDLRIVEGRLVAELGRYFDSSDESTRNAVQLALEPDGTWIRLPEPVPFERPPTPSACMTPPIDRVWLTRIRPRGNDFDQEVATCTVHEGVRWGGISFYEGEGYWGVGGLVRHDSIGREYEYRRPDGLENLSVNALISFGGHLLLGTTVHTEYAGPEPGFAVRRYDPNAEFLSAVSEVCGFAVRKFVVFESHLWVATDLGLARARPIGGGRLEWQNFVPAPNEQSPMRPIECDALYGELLRAPQLGTATAFDMGYAFEEFVERLADLRPDFLARYLRRLNGQPAIDNVAGALAP